MRHADVARAAGFSGQSATSSGTEVGVVIFARLVPGGPETRRVSHVFPLAGIGHERATALCGFNARLDELELLRRVAGMPCERCLLHPATQPARDEVPAPREHSLAMDTPRRVDQ